MAFAAAAGAVRWSVFAMTANVTAMALVEPSHCLSFALLHLACMRLNLRGKNQPSGRIHETRGRASDCAERFGDCGNTARHDGYCAGCRWVYKPTIYAATAGWTF
jgi:hypothetical protein